MRVWLEINSWIVKNVHPYFANAPIRTNHLQQIYAFYECKGLPTKISGKRPEGWPYFWECYKTALAKIAHQNRPFKRLRVRSLTVTVVAWAERKTNNWWKIFFVAQVRIKTREGGERYCRRYLDSFSHKSFFLSFSGFLLFNLLFTLPLFQRYSS